ncbi:MAG: hypothetical protein HY554_14885 [Elusimicrobia bacterium]|nr:hypothetical protein [Elusimicrobiota bacterium]
MRRKSGHLLKASLIERSTLLAHIRDGLGALNRNDVRLVADTERAKIEDSLDLDAASANQHPEENRWDYILSVPSLSQLVGLEPHPAKDSEIKVVIAKRTKSLEFLRSHLRAGIHVSQWIWVTRGTVGFSRMEKARRRLDQSGIRFTGRLLQNLG